MTMSLKDMLYLSACEIYNSILNSSLDVSQFTAMILLIKI